MAIYVIIKHSMIKLIDKVLNKIEYVMNFNKIMTSFIMIFCLFITYMNRHHAIIFPTIRIMCLTTIEFRMTFSLIFLITIHFILFDYANQIGVIKYGLKYINVFLCMGLLYNCSLINNAFGNYQYKITEYKATEQYVNQLVTTIKNTEGYYTDIKVCFANDKYGNIMVTPSDFAILKDKETYDATDGTVNGDLLFELGWAFYPSLRIFAAYKPNIVSNEENIIISNKDEVKNMPLYPADGSIKIIDDVLVVKLY